MSSGDSDQGSEGSTASRPSEGLVPPVNVWTRWDDDAEGEHGDEGLLPLEDLHFHRYCAVPRFDTFRESAPKDAEDEIWFLDGHVRTGLRQTPLVVAVVAAVFLLSAELSPQVDGISAFLPSVPSMAVPAAIGAGVLWFAMLRLAMSVDLVQRNELAKAVLVYGLLTALLAGTVVSVVLVVVAPDPRAIEPNVVFTSGYLLMLLLGGLLVYDGMLKTENMFENLGQTYVVESDEEVFEDGVDGDPDRPRTKADVYRKFVSELDGALRDTTSLPGVGDVPTSHLFAVLFVSQFAAVWWLQQGPQNLEFWVTLWGNVLLDVFIVIVAFRFLVLVKYFHELVTDSFEVEVPGGDGETRAVELLTYQPFHPDGRGGFRDLGKFATRVNVLLILAGLYVVFRLYVQGTRALPDGSQPLSFLQLDPGLDVVVWTVSYIGPLLAYAIAAGAWLYYSFWALHRKMARDRERQYIEYQFRRRQDEEDDLSENVRLGAFDEGTDWHELRQTAPVWPIRTRLLVSLVSGSVAPLFLTLPRFLF